jgi:hypothetical protein
MVLALQSSWRSVGSGVTLHWLLTSALDKGQWSTSRPGQITPGKEPHLDLRALLDGMKRLCWELNSESSEPVANSIYWLGYRDSNYTKRQTRITFLFLKCVYSKNWKVSILYTNEKPIGGSPSLLTQEHPQKLGRISWNPPSLYPISSGIELRPWKRDRHAQDISQQVQTACHILSFDLNLIFQLAAEHNETPSLYVTSKAESLKPNKILGFHRRQNSYLGVQC